MSLVVCTILGWFFFFCNNYGTDRLDISDIWVRSEYKTFEVSLIFKKFVDFSSNIKHAAPELLLSRTIPL